VANPKVTELFMEQGIKSEHLCSFNLSSCLWHRKCLLCKYVL